MSTNIRPRDALTAAGAELHEREGGAIELVVRGIPQSWVAADQTALRYPYTRWIGRMLDAVGRRDAPLRVLHLGAGALTLPRSVANRRPGSTQVVVESQRELCEAVLDRIPLRSDARDSIELVYGDARDVVEGADRGGVPLGGAFDGIVVDLWDAATVHARVASQEFYAAVARHLAPQGVLAVNLLDGDDFGYARAQAAALREVLPRVAVVGDGLGETGDRPPLGNVVLAASRLSVDRFLGDVTATRVVHGSALDSWIGNAEPATDLTATDSPSPDDPRFS
ncbi:fused MFS/spermidine synthase [Herbiconiux moechotypicola]|uniref:Spermidine synthase n=1 Tax=Herbiconiux moechotypicola TaxID=637393 RepID=A0ABN3DVU8_9MICO|nr:fused MFS/spermidine synthase [Herbiconiux moechotypicola]MCS5730948.1 fused MFS/spermidine synthase [Herbiconiux moechotypicola]